MKKVIFILSLGLLAISGYPQNYVALVKLHSGNKWGYANIKGEVIIPPQFVRCSKFSSDGLAPVYSKESNKYYFINTVGAQLNTQILNFKLIDNFGNFGVDLKGYSSGLAAIKVGKLWGYLDASGRMAIAVKFDKVSEFNDGYGVAESGSKFIVLNAKGEEFPVEDANVVEVKRFSEGLAPYRSSDRKFGFIGTNGKVVIPAQFEGVGYFNDGLAWAKTVSLALGYINPKGEWVVRPRFDVGEDFEGESGLARVKNETGHWEYVNASDEIVKITDTTLFGDFRNGLAVGRKNEMVGFYNKKGEWVIAPQFEAARHFKNGFAAARKNGMWGVIDREGKWIVEPKFDAMMDMELVKE